MSGRFFNGKYLFACSLLLIPVFFNACGVGFKSFDSIGSSLDVTNSDPNSGSSAQEPPINPDSKAFLSFQKNVLPVLTSSKCNTCHTGARFAYTSLLNDLPKDYRNFLDMISLDNPEQSRLLAKILPGSDPNAIEHGGGAIVTGTSDPVYLALKQWILDEQQEKCAACGIKAPKQFVAYVKQPQIFWSIDKAPRRSDWGVRTGARILLQPVRVDAQTGKLARENQPPVDFLEGSGFCESGDCDFGHISVNHAGNAVAFECRVPVNGEVWVERNWNICIADIDLQSGKALRPHFLMPNPLSGWTFTRVSPFMLGCLSTTSTGDCANYGPDPNQQGFDMAGLYGRHSIWRQRNDITPIFSADDSRVIFASQRVDPRTSEESVQSYHGTEHLYNIVSAKLDGSDLRTIYRNEGGVADLPFLLKNGNISFHVWALDRMDHHMYLQSTADGMIELPTLMGRTQGPNMWGKAVQLTNGLIVGMTGNRRGAAEVLQPFIGDHTLGTSLETNVSSFKLLGPNLIQEFDAFPNGYCTNPPNGKNCSASQYFNDPQWSPDGRALIAHNSSRTYFGNDKEDGEAFYRYYNSLGITNYLPKNFGISMIDKSGNIEVLISNPSGYILRYPTWVGRRQSPRIQPEITNESLKTATIHIADFKIWLSLQLNHTDKTNLMQNLERIKSVRVSYKEMTANACLSDGASRSMTNTGFDFDHPTPLGVNNASGFIKFEVPVSMGGDGHGDIPLQPDNSVLITVPAGKMLLFQGIDENGFTVDQHTRLFALPPRPASNIIQASVPRDQYNSQCISCHGSLDRNTPFVSIADFGKQSNFKPLDFTVTQAYSKQPVDLTRSEVQIKTMTFKDAIRPLVNRSCVSCHSGESPAGQLSLQEDYSSTGNYPSGMWVNISNGLCNSYVGCGQYTQFVPSQNRQSSYNSSPSYRWLLKPDDQPSYRNYYANQISQDQPIGNLSPWDVGYQNLMRNNSANGEYYYMSYNSNTNFGRGGDLASKSYLIDVLTGSKLDPSKSYTGSQNHHGMLSDEEIRTLKGVIDLGFAYMSRCDGESKEYIEYKQNPNGKLEIPSGKVRSGPYQGLPYGDIKTRQVPKGFFH